MGNIFMIWNIICCCKSNLLWHTVNCLSLLKCKSLPVHLKWLQGKYSPSGCNWDANLFWTLGGHLQWVPHWSMQINQTHFATGVRVTMECFWNWTPCLETSLRENIPATHVEYRAACLWSIKAKRVSWFLFTSQWSNQEEGNWKSSKVIPFLINFATNSRDLSCLQLGYGYILYGLSHFISGWCWQLLLRLLSWSISAREPQEVLWVSQIFEISLQ